MKRKLSILIALFIIIPLWANSQTIITGNLYIENKSPINPAYAGAQNCLNAFVDYRNTAAPLEGAPSLISFGANMPIYRKMSLGGRFYKQSEGLFDVINSFVDYSYWLQIAKGHFLRFGVSAGIRSNQINYSKIIADDPSAIIDVASKNFVGVSFQSAAGIVYQWKNFEWSLSLPQLYESKNSLNPTYQSLFTYLVQLKNQNLSLKPSIFVNYKNNNPILYDINLQAYWKQLFFLGFGYRNRPGFIASAGVKINQVNIAYSIELGAEKYSNIFSQIHEISISYSFGKKKKMPNDSIIIPYNQLAEQNDSISNKDSLNKVDNTKDTVLIGNSEKIDSLQLNKSAESKYKIEDAGEGIYVIKSIGSDSTDLNLGVDFSNLDVDSLVVRHLVHQIENKNDVNDVNIVNEGEGVFTIKSNSNTNDSLSRSDEITEQKIDSLANTENFINKMFTNKELKPATGQEVQFNYTIQLLINNSNKYLLNNSEIVGEARIEKNTEGEINYFYGHFDTEAEAIEIVQKFKKYKDLEVNILQKKSVP